MCLRRRGEVRLVWRAAEMRASPRPSATYDAYRAVSCIKLAISAVHPV
jgi:hypothetical protein